MTKMLRALVGSVAMLLVLSGCFPGAGSSSQDYLKYDLVANITKAKVNLNSQFFNYLDPDGTVADESYYQVTSNGGKTVADVDLKFENIKGNWSVSGKWMHGAVQMEFAGKSEYLESLLNHCMASITFSSSAPTTAPSGTPVPLAHLPIYDWDFGGGNRPSDYNGDLGGDYDTTDCLGVNPYTAPNSELPLVYNKWVSGGCVTIPTLYRSLNREYPGTGHALIAVCQNGSGLNYYTNSWSNASYIEIWIPDTTAISEKAIGSVTFDFYRDLDFWYIADCVGDDSLDLCQDGGDPEYDLSVEYAEDVFYSEGYFENDNSPFRNYFAGGINTNRSAKWSVQIRLNNLATETYSTQSPLFTPSTSPTALVP